MTNEVATVATPEWRIAGEWLDVCSCNSPCPCTFAQPPTGNHCEVLWAYRINEGHYGPTPMAGLKVVLLANFTGNLWDGAWLDAGVFSTLPPTMHSERPWQQFSPARPAAG